ncbi:DUF3558 domain-containing protein [Actinokineospora diospyrosa]|uniref:DUF3558 domain-containing protein n=1 Tax=Actinokineospora diospyrosa TaxID=103728 RepID=UPI0031D404D1
MVAGCTATETGTPTTTVDGGETTAPNSSESPTKTSVSVPPRPKTLKLDSIDPCALLTADQRAGLKIDSFRPQTNSTEQYRGAKECAFEISAKAPYYRYYATLVTTEGVEVWLSGDRNVDAKLISIGDFAAVRYDLAGQGANAAPCTVAVDVAQDQQLLIRTSTSGKDFTQDEVCRMSEKAADLALTTLKTLA